ncbi:MAG: flagellar motor switch protein FliM [Helicobacter sp.]|nr:flagellar motor switch protein FliM [Helicobacter sp.]
MSKILSQDELDELLTDDETQEPLDPIDAPDPHDAPQEALDLVDAPDPHDTPQEALVIPYDFRRPNRVSKEQLRAFRGIHDKMARSLSAQISSIMRSIAEFSLQDVVQMTYGEFVATLQSPTSFNVFSMKPMDASGILEISPDIAFSMIDRLLGGKGNSYDSEREFSDIELNLLDSILKQIMQTLRDVWAPVVDIYPSVDAKESSPNVIQIVTQNEIVIAVSFIANISQNSGSINICYPVISLDGFLSRLANRDLVLSETSNKKSRNKELQALLGGASVDLSAILGSIKLSLGDVFDLKIGDVLRLNSRVSDDIIVSVDNRDKFKAKMGLKEFNKTIKITEHIKSEKDELKEILSALELERRSKISEIEEEYEDE